MASESTGVVDVTSSYAVAESIDRLEALVRQRGLIVFARIDFSGDAARAGAGASSHAGPPLRQSTGWHAAPRSGGQEDDLRAGQVLVVAVAHVDCARERPPQGGSVPHRHAR